MPHATERFISEQDAARLAHLLGHHRRTNPRDLDDLEALAELLDDAGGPTARALPRDAVRLGAPVEIRIDGEPHVRRVAVVEPVRADARLGRISVLSPLGRALIGRRAGARVQVERPDGRTTSVAIVVVQGGGDGA